MQPDPYVIFATPTLSSHVSYEFCGAMESAMSSLALSKIRSAHIFWPGLQFVDAARNALSTQFLGEYPDGTDFFFVDDDVGGFTAEQVGKFVASPLDVIAGVPPLKGDRAVPEFPVHVASDDDGKPIMEGGLFLAYQIPLGFVRIKRAVLERFASESQTYSIAHADGSLKVLFNIFDCGPKNGEFTGEDTTFCDKCRAAGIDIWVDPDIKFQHRGSKRWEASLRDALRSYEAGQNPSAQVRKRRDAA